MEVGDCARDTFGGVGEADAPAGHGVGFAAAVDGDDLVSGFGDERGRAGVGAFVDEVFVNFVADDPESAFGAEGDDLADEIGGEYGSGGIVGGVEDDRLGVGLDGGGDVFKGGDAAVFGVSLDDARLGTGEEDLLIVGAPEGGDEDDFVAGIAEDLEGVVDAVLCAAGDDDLAGFGGEVVLFGEFSGDGLAEGG